MYIHFLDENVIKLNEDLIKIFNNYGYEDISYGNDCCNSVCYNLGNNYYFQIFIPNSNNDNNEYEQWNTFSIYLQNPDMYLDNLLDLYNFTKNIEDVLGFVESNKNIKL